VRLVPFVVLGVVAVVGVVFIVGLFGAAFVALIHFVVRESLILLGWRTRTPEELAGRLAGRGWGEERQGNLEEATDLYEKSLLLRPNPDVLERYQGVLEQLLERQRYEREHPFE